MISLPLGKKGREAVSRFPKEMETTSPLRSISMMAKSFEGMEGIDERAS